MSENNQTDVKQLIDIIDRALTSNDERVINALRSLMMITLLTSTDDPDNRAGPLGDMMQTVNRLHNRVNDLEREISRNRNDNPWEDKWRSKSATDYSKSATDYYFDSIKAQRATSSTGYGAIPPLTAQGIADLTKQLNSPLVDKNRKI